MRAASAAVTFLTRVPVGRWVAIDAADVARSVVFFPVVGAGIGAAGAGVALLAHQRLTPLLAAVLSVAVVVGLTGAMHVDALADTADALGGATRERRLELMRDSRLGTFGVCAVALDLAVRAAVIEQLLVSGGVLRPLIAAGALSRCAPVAVAAVLPYPGARGSTGSVLSGRTSALGAAATVAVGITIAVVAAGLHGVVLAAAVASSTALLSLWFRPWLGGATGDALGTTCEVGELVALVAAAGLA